MKKWGFFAAATLWAVYGLALAPAFADTDSKMGFPIGEKSKIHTDLDLAVGYDSNPGRAAAGVSDWKMHARPSLLVDVPGTDVHFNLGGQVLIEQFFGTNGGSDTKFGGDVGTRLRLGSSATTFGFELVDRLVRTPSFFGELGTVGVDEIRFTQWQNRGLANMVLRPGGHALELRLGYGNEMNFYDDLPQSQRHYINFETKWKFLPKTAAIFAADFGFFSAKGAPSGGPSGTNDATPLNVAVGLQGQITARLATTLRVGFGDTFSWTNGFFSTAASENVATVIGTADVTYEFMLGSSFSLGYERFARAIILFDTYTADAPYAKLVLAPTERLSLGLYGRYEWRQYSGSSSAHAVMGDARVDYWFFEFLRGGIAYQVGYQKAAAGSTQVGTLESFTRHTALFTVGLHY